MSLHHHQPSTSGEPPTVHGMAVVGTNTVFLSHLPMFMPLHDCQLLAQAEFINPDGRQSNRYENDRKNHPNQQLYTLRPEPFVLSELLELEQQPGRSYSFEGTVFRNHYERAQTDPEAVAPDVVVNVKRIVHARRFDPAAERPQQLEYILFGAGDEVFLAHRITSPPDFDQLIRVRLDRPLSEEDLAAGFTVTVPGRRDNSRERIRLKDGRISAELRLNGQDIPIEIEPLQEFYLEEDELRE